MCLQRSLSVPPSLEEVEGRGGAGARRGPGGAGAAKRRRVPGRALRHHARHAPRAFHCQDQKRDATRLLKLDTLHGLFDDVTMWGLIFD
jgi:hypothetical protein